MDESEIVSLGGPVEKYDGKLQLRIPLIAGSLELSKVARGISEIEGDLLIVTIPDWLSKRLGIEEGTPVIVDNQNGKFNITLDRSVQ
jgi:hypothetical protein